HLVPAGPDEPTRAGLRRLDSAFRHHARGRSGTDPDHQAHHQGGLMRKHQLSRWAVAVPMAILALATIYPLLFVTNVSTKTRHEYVLDQFGLADQLTPVNFVDAWTSSDLGRYIVNSVT